MQNKQLANKNKQNPARDHPRPSWLTNSDPRGPPKRICQFIVIPVGEYHILSCTIW